MVNAEIAESIVKNTIFRNWKQIQQQCRQRDADNSGTINVVDLKGWFLFHNRSNISMIFFPLTKMLLIQINWKMDFAKRGPPNLQNKVITYFNRNLSIY